MKSDKGYSLIFVIITTSLVGILIATLMHLSIVNVKMKEVGRKSEKNFYRTESVLDQYQKDIEQFAATMLKKAYVETLEEYSAIANDSNRDLANQISGLYLTYLITGGPNDTDHGLSLSDVKTLNPASYFPNHKDNCFADYSISNISPSGITVSAISTVLPNYQSYGAGIVSFGDTIDLRLNMTKREEDGDEYERSLILKNVKVKETDDDGTETIIQTDIKIKVPHIALGQSDIYPEYTRYALIADTSVEVGDGKNDVGVEGNLYAGAGGISLSALNFNMKGSVLVNRGDLVLYSSSNGTSAKLDVDDIWAENIRTEKTISSVNPITLSAVGTDDVNIHVSNDLVINAPNSNVSVKGSYKGFSFNRNNDNTTTPTGDYSSALLINGKNSNLSMDLTQGLIAGRAFVSARGAEEAGNSASNGAIMLGQSLGVKSDQLSYMIPSDYLSGKANPVVLHGIDTTDDEFKLDSTHIKSDVEREKIASLLSPTNPVSKRYYKMRGGSGLVLCYLFYNFKDAKAATTYYREYCNSENLEKKAEQGGYIDSILDIDSTTLYLAGYLANMKVQRDGSLAITSIKNPYEKYEDLPATTQDSDDAKFQRSAQSIAKTELRMYACYQLRLMYDAGITIPGGGNRFELKDDERYSVFRQVVAGADYVNDLFKQDGELKEFRNTPKETAAGDYQYSGGSEDDLKINSMNDDENAKIIHVKYDGTNWATVYLFYNPNTPVDLSTVGWFNGGSSEGRESKGIVVAYGDVNIGSSFDGIIICGGKATITNSNVKITADEVLVQSVFNKMKEDGDPYNVLKYFAGFQTESSSESVMDPSLNVATGFSYENWKKMEN